jgi:hypothetical protein
MIRRRLTNTSWSEHISPAPQRRRISRIPSPSPPSDERDDDLGAAIRLSYLAERARVRDALRREIGDDLLSVVQEGLRNMSPKARRRVQSRLVHLLAGQ